MFLKKFFSLLIFAVILIPTVGLAAEKPRVAVVPFENISIRQVPQEEKLLKQIALYVQDEVVSTEKFDPPNRMETDIKKLLDEIKFSQSDLADPETRLEYGKMTGAQYLILGTITGLSQKGNDIIAHVSLRMIEVETARIYLAGRGSGKSKGDYEEVLRNAAEDALNGKRGMLTMMRGGKK